MDVEALESIRYIVTPLEESFGLCNDYYSYWKEKADIRGGDYPNAVKFLMKTDGVSEETALEIIKGKILSLEEAHYLAFRSSMEDNALSLDQIRYILYLQLAHGGWHVFHSTGYRYKTDPTRKGNIGIEIKQIMILMACPIALMVLLFSMFG